MTVKDNLASAFNTMIQITGKPISLNYYTMTIGSVYDDDVTLSASGAAYWTSGIVLPINSQKGNYDALLVEEGKLTSYDQRLYVNGSLALTGSNTEVRIGLKTAGQIEYFSIVPIGTIPAEVQNTMIYKKAYIRRLTNGSLVGA